MVGIDPSIISHKLNVDPTFKSIKQKRRKFAPERNKVINDEVDNLLKTNDIQFIQSINSERNLSLSISLFLVDLTKQETRSGFVFRLIVFFAYRLFVECSGIQLEGIPFGRLRVDLSQAIQLSFIVYLIKTEKHEITHGNEIGGGTVAHGNRTIPPIAGQTTMAAERRPKPTEPPPGSPKPHHQFGGGCNRWPPATVVAAIFDSSGGTNVVDHPPGRRLPYGHAKAAAVVGLCKSRNHRMVVAAIVVDSTGTMAAATVVVVAG
ncbi:LOW QUALITY PROTEIN: hypothetical protein OSB04_019100 [Centaurea solstitialis]|uniref:Uncharacterized protein n=1 Tax=Centaurea solstitialis TaxID=347529 RepID=A0AA38W4Q7_9ASTR|nr:LOW QUALITY PROTEIN: hypothetical protein OSB04_019100 [Centaurea solstitialis]